MQNIRHPNYSHVNNIKLELIQFKQFLLFIELRLDMEVITTNLVLFLLSIQEHMIRN